MEMKELIAAIEQRHRELGIKINPPASDKAISELEKKVGFTLPADFKEFYSICNGFECDEDQFIMMPVEWSLDYGYRRSYDKGWFMFSEYMVICDWWGLRSTPNYKYEIYNGSYREKAMTSSLQEFLERFLRGNVFDEGGLYEWMEELGIVSK